MTYRYMEMCAGAKMHALDLTHVAAVVPLDESGNELPHTSDYEELMLWNRKVVKYEIVGNIAYATLESKGERKLK